MLLFKDNIVPTAQVAITEAAKYSFQLLPHLFYLPDFFLFLNLKSHLRGRMCCGKVLREPVYQLLSWWNCDDKASLNPVLRCEREIYWKIVKYFSGSSFERSKNYLCTYQKSHKDYGLFTYKSAPLFRPFTIVYAAGQNASYFQKTITYIDKSIPKSQMI